MSYSIQKKEEYFQIIIEALREGSGKVKACEIAKLPYATFMKWIREYNYFKDQVDEADKTGASKIKDLAESAIIGKFQDTWQSAAWWLERKYPEQYRQRQELSHQGVTINITKKVVDPKNPKNTTEVNK